jgi:hypothetical protein
MILLNIYFPVALRPNAGHGLLVLEVSRSHNDAPQTVGLLWTSDHFDEETSISQHSQETNIHVRGGIQTYDPSKRAAAGIDPKHNSGT